MRSASRTRPLHGIEGWLALFLFTLAVLWPLYQAVDLCHALAGDRFAGAAGADAGLVEALAWANLLATVATSWFLAAVLATRREGQSVRVAVWGMWLLLLVPAVLMLLLIAGLTGVRLQTAGAMVDAVGNRGLGWTALATAYLLRSPRVRAAYPEMDASR